MKYLTKFMGVWIILVVGCILAGTAFSEESPDEVLNILKQGEQFQLSRFTTGQGVIAFEYLSAGFKEVGVPVKTIHKRCCNIKSAFNGSKVRLEIKQATCSDNSSVDTLGPDVTIVATDWKNIKFFYPDRKIIELGVFGKGDEKETKMAMPFYYGAFFTQISPLYKLSVAGKTTVDGSSCYIIKGIYEQIKGGKKRQSFVEAVVDPQCGYLTRYLKYSIKDYDEENEFLGFERKTILKEYSPGLWAPCESTEIVYNGVNSTSPAYNIKDAKLLGMKVSMKVLEYSFNVSLSSKDLDTGAPLDTRLFDIQTGIAITP